MIARLNKHIEQLLAQHTCVIIPGLGSFLLEVQPAHLDSSMGLIYPTSLELCFNELLQNQDGLLAESYAHTYAISHRRARLMLEEDVRNLRNSLINRRRIALPSLGTLSLNEDGRIVFEPQSIQVFQGASYGLSPIVLPKTYRDEAVMSRQDGQDYLHLRISKRSLSWASAVVVFLLALLPWGSSVEREPLYRASVAPTEINLPKNILPTAEEETTEIEQAPQNEWLTPISGQYYIIIATEKKPEKAQVHYHNAQQWLEQEQQHNLGILQDNRLYRVSAAHFSEAANAYAYIKEINKLGREAWVYRAK